MRMQAKKEYEKKPHIFDAGAHTSAVMIGKSPRYQNQFDYHIFHVWCWYKKKGTSVVASVACLCLGDSSFP